MKKLISKVAVFLLFTSLSALASEKAELFYEDYFGDYFAGSQHEISIDPTQDSPKSLFEKIKQLNPKAGLEADFLLIAYGAKDMISNYIAGTRNLANETPLLELSPLSELKRRETAKFILTFVSKSYSHYISPTAPFHHPYSHIAHLPKIGRVIKFF